LESEDVVLGVVVLNAHTDMNTGHKHGCFDMCCLYNVGHGEHKSIY